MRPSAVRALRCPVCRCGLRLEECDVTADEIASGRLTCDCGQTYSIENGTPNLVYPERLRPSDKEFQQKYDSGADKYDEGLEWLFASFFENEEEVRQTMVALLEIGPNARVLEVGCGTGKDSALIAARLGPAGALYAQEISSGMLALARRRLAASPAPVDYFLSNAAYLPFADGWFDAVFHFGGLNTFGEVERALAEMTRVTRRGGKVVVGDEGVAPWLRTKEFGRVLISANPLYEHQPPLASLPDNAREVRVRWILGNAFYVIDYRVDEGPPNLDLDLPIPGKGDSLRLRYERRTKRE